MIRRVIIFIAVALATACGASQSSKDGGPETGSSCPPGKQITCGCAGNPTGGTQVCKDDGSGYGTCMCADGGKVDGGRDARGDSTIMESGPETGPGDGGGKDSGPLTGSFAWDRQYGSASGSPSVVGVATDASGNIVLTGSFTGTVDFGKGPLKSAGSSAAFVVKLDPSGKTLWSKSYGGSGDNGGNSVAVDASGNVIVVGGFDGSIDFGGGGLTATTSSYDIFLAKFDSSGGYVWAKSFGDANLQTGRGVAVDGSGNVFIDGANWGIVNFGTGALSATGSMGDLYLAKFDSTGASLWSKGFHNTGNSLEAELWRVAVDASGNALFTGAFYGTINFGAGLLTSAGFRDVFVVKFDSAGKLSWANRYGDALDQEGSNLAVDSAGGVYVVGNFNGTLDLGTGTMAAASTGGDIFLAKLDASGKGVWSKHFGDANSSNVGSVQQVGVDGFGSVTIGGGVTDPGGSTDFGGGALPYLGDGSRSDPFVATYRADGSYGWAYLGNNDGSASALCLDEKSNIILAGTFGSGISDAGISLTFAGASLMSVGAVDTFVLKLSP